MLTPNQHTQASEGQLAGPTAVTPGATHTSEILRDNLRVLISDKGPRENSVEAQLEFHSEISERFLLVTVKGLTDLEFAGALEALYRSQTIRGSDGRLLHSPKVVHHFLQVLENLGASLSTLSTREDARLISRFYEQNYRNCDTKKLPQPEPLLVTLGRKADQAECTTDAETIKWKRLVEPTHEQLREAGKECGLPLKDLKRCLMKDEEPSNKVRDRHIVMVLNEVVEDPKIAGRITRHPIFLIITNNELVTVNHHKSYVLDRVGDELMNNENPLAPEAGPTWIAARILGSAVHRAEDVLAELQRQTKIFRDEQRVIRQTEDSRKYRDRLLDSADEILLGMHGMDEAITILQGENQTLHPKGKPSLDRYPSRLAAIAGRVSLLKDMLDRVEDSWATNEEQVQTAQSKRQNWASHKLAEGVALFAPTSVVLGYFEVFPQALSAGGKYISIGLAFVVSAAAIVGLHRLGPGKKHNKQGAVSGQETAARFRQG